MTRDYWGHGKQAGMQTSKAVFEMTTPYILESDVHTYRFNVPAHQNATIDGCRRIVMEQFAEFES